MCLVVFMRMLLQMLVGVVVRVLVVVHVQHVLVPVMPPVAVLQMKTRMESFLLNVRPAFLATLRFLVASH